MEMRKSKVHKFILGFLGITLTGLGLWRVLDPIAFFEFSGVILDSDPGQLNEARGSGGAVVGFGIIILLGAFKHKMAFTSTVAAIALYYGFALARIVGFGLDGDPVDGQVQGTVVEIISGSLALFSLIRFRNKKINS